ncbi:TonB-dependent receptor [Rhodopseudomonas sp. HC1]|uniref:TonB-dependent receptor n=1 Tax=Rhodopseudomonas infernalis TaxID=2897386 RepID=UPI001EE8512B|nr:TonB-dependent receptor [Rhodopseudomonas infernalis]MCG6203131.1 TonB-dependent receptor [Rhodopseudomonas infernalis]
MTRRNLIVLLMCSVSYPAIAQQAVILDEITVTAQKRPEQATDVPISIDVWSGQRLAESRTLRRDQALSATPNAQMGTVSGSLYTNFTAIRGVGSALIDTDPAVGLYVDGVAAGASQTYGGNLLDIDRVEILRGPQGTLYGRNNLAGSVNVISNLPDPSRTYGEFGVDYGRFNTARSFGFFNTPIGNSGWAVRGALSGSRNDGYTPDDATGGKVNSLQDISGRFSVMGPVSDTVDFLGSVEHERQRTVDGAFMSEADFQAGRRSVDIVNPFNGTLSTTTARAQFTARLDNGDRLVSLTGFRTNETDFKGNSFPQGYFAATNAFFRSVGVAGFQYRADNPFNGSYDQVSQEFRYESDRNERFKWVGGLYAERSHGSRQYGLTNSFDSGGFLSGSGVTLQSKGVTDTTALAAFADGTFALTERWKVFGGARLGYDHKEFSYDFRSDNASFNTIFTPVVAGFAPAYLASLSAPYVTPRFGTQFEVTDTFNVYASLSRGYKSGGFNAGFVALGDEKAFDAETLWSYEAGWKGRFLADRLSLNGSVFFMDWRNQQVQTFNVATQSTPIQNAPKSRSYGAELEARLKLDDHWSVRAGLGYVDATYVDFKNALATGASTTIDVGGNQQQYVSKFSGTVSLGYAWNVGYDDLQGAAEVAYQFRSGFYFDVANTLRQPAYGLLNARIGVENERYAAHLWGLNLADQRYRVSATDFGLGSLIAVGTPLTVGATFKIKFSQQNDAHAIVK